MSLIGNFVHIAISNASNGSMSRAVSDDEKFKNRHNFLSEQDIKIDQSVLVHLTYDTNNFRRYKTIDIGFAGDGMVREPSVEVDALFTNSNDIALFLPIADCIAAVLYDPVHRVIGLAHLGRHNLEESGGSEIVRYMQSEFKSRPEDIVVWLSPAAGKDNYPLFAFDNRSLHEVALEQLLTTGVNESNITIDSRDTTLDMTLFSHSEFLKGNRQTDGRQAVVCKMKS